MPDGYGRIREIDFMDFLERLLQQRMGHNWEIVREARIGRGHRPDFLLLPREPGEERPWIIEAKLVAPLTGARLESFINQITEYGQRFSTTYPNTFKPVLVLATLAPLSARHHEFLRFSGIDHVFDREFLQREADTYGLGGEFERLITGFEGRIERIEREPDAAEALLSRLENTNAGKQDWAQYQSLCADILAYLFCPPLEQPLTENSTSSKVNRRDIILPNYCTEGFFNFLRINYRADYIVADAKNYKGRVSKGQMLQMANYLSDRGVGLFGLIITRMGADGGASYVQREQWIYHKKLILILVDEDIRQMIEMKRSGADPVTVLRQKIEDFRLAI